MENKGNHTPVCIAKKVSEQDKRFFDLMEFLESTRVKKQLLSLVFGSQPIPCKHCGGIHPDTISFEYHSN